MHPHGSIRTIGDTRESQLLEMNLAEFRERVAKGIQPRMPTLEEGVDILRAAFDANRICQAKLGRMHVMCTLRLSDSHNKLFFDWLISTQYDAFVIPSGRDGARMIQPFEKELAQYPDTNKTLTYICFIPKGATKEEIELTTNATFIS